MSIPWQKHHDPCSEGCPILTEQMQFDDSMSVGGAIEYALNEDDDRIANEDALHAVVCMFADNRNSTIFLLY